jgi:hypothetical protein
MKRFAWSAILAVAVLAIGTAAQAAIVNVDLSFTDAGTGAAITGSVNPGQVLNWEITISVSDNAYSVGQYGPWTTGVQAAEIGLSSTGPGVVEIPEGMNGGFGGTDPTGAPADGTVVYNTLSPPDGFGVPGTGTPVGQYTDDGNRGLKSGLLSLPAANPVPNPPATYYETGFTDVLPEYKLGVDSPILFANGSMTVVGQEGDGVTYTPTIRLPDGTNYNLSVFTIDESNGQMMQRSVNVNADTLNLNGQTLTVIPEPATMGLLGFGVLGLLKRRRRA